MTNFDARARLGKVENATRFKVDWTWAPLFPLQCLVMCDTLHYEYCHHAYVLCGYMYYAIILSFKCATRR